MAHPMDRAASELESDDDYLSDLEEEEEEEEGEEQGGGGQLAPSKSGWMMKQGGQWKTWRKRFFRLKNQALTYATKEDTGKGVNKGTVLLEGCVVREADAKTKKKHSFEISHPGRRTFYMHCQSEEERAAWVAALEGAILAPVSRERNLALKEKKLRASVRRLRERLLKVTEVSERRRTDLEMLSINQGDTDLRARNAAEAAKAAAAENESLRAQLAEAKSERDEAQLRGESLKKKVEKLTGVAKTVAAASNASEENLKEAKEKKKVLKGLAKQLKADLDAKTAEAAELSNRVVALEDQLAASRAQIAAQEQELQRAREALAAAAAAAPPPNARRAAAASVAVPGRRGGPPPGPPPPGQPKRAPSAPQQHY